ncbi:MAG: phosphatase PAP2 family protein, partial [Acidimicrobiia bacterium]
MSAATDAALDAHDLDAQDLDAQDLEHVEHGRSELACGRPTTDASRRRRWATWPLAVALALAFVALAGTTAVSAGPGALDDWGHRAAIEMRSPAATAFFEIVTHLGAGLVVSVAALGVAAVIWRRCPVLASLILFAGMARPLLSMVLKESVARPRPDGDVLVHPSSASFPSGHTFAAVVFWGMLPLVVAAVTSHRVARVASVGVAVVAVALVGASRVYLGAHWLTDVVGSVLVGGACLVLVTAALDHLHRSPGV